LLWSFLNPLVFILFYGAVAASAWYGGLGAGLFAIALSITRLHGGLGLGLAIVRCLVELHGGTVSVDSPGDGLGATFTISLPLLEGQPEMNEGSFPNRELDLTGTRILS
jgi:signal transduction histidine kinase